ncbi:MAG: LPS export ABC transporter protein LptC [Hyphomicrobiaceae bacterium]|jgi:LPS export ABC transporter protein LptC
MRRRRLLRWLLGAGAIALVALLFLGVRDPRTLISVFDLGRLADNALPELLQRISNFHRIITRDGKRILEISASRADYFKDDRTVLIVAPRIVFYDGGVRAGEISGTEGRLTMTDGEVERVALVGTVILELSDFKLYAEDVVYERTKERFMVNGAVEIRSPKLTLAGRDLVIDVLERKLVMESDVSMRIEGGQG